jgi:hypothetical protein
MAEVAPSALAVPASRIREIAELAMRLDAEAARPEDRILRLYFGESNIPTPDYIKRAAQKAMADGFTFYTENAGLPSLRRMLARHYESMHAVELDPACEIVVTASGMQALNTGIRCTLDPGDEAIVLTPAWGNQSASVRMANATPREVPLRRNGARYEVDFEAIEAAVSPRTRLLIYTSPSNPLGWVATREEQTRLLDFARRHDLWLLADEVYERLWYGGINPGDPAPSILRLANRQDPLFVTGSFSKSYCMTGWRVGWIAARKDLAAKATQFNEFVISHAPSFAQRAAETALEWGEDTLRKMLGEYRGNRDFALAALRKIPGFTVPEADGAFYLFPRVEGLTDSLEFCRRFLLDSRVGLAPGVAFGAGGEGCLRVCYAVERPMLEAALVRLREFVTAGTR